MQHKAKGHGKDKIERPGNKAPVEEREHACPFCYASHLFDMRIRRIHRPLGKGVKQDVCGKTAGEHHGAPGKEVVLWLLVLFSKDNIAILGESQEEADEQNANADKDVVGTECISEEEPDIGDNSICLIREDKQINCQCHDQDKRHKGYQPVYPALVCCTSFFTHCDFPPLIPAVAGNRDNCGQLP